MNYFEFTTGNINAFYFAFIPGLTGLGLVIYILISFPRNRLVNVFGLLTLSGSIWQFSDSIARICATEALADFWDGVFCIGWLFIGPLSIHFSLLYSKAVKSNMATLLLGLIYVPAFGFVSIYNMHIFPHHFTFFKFWGWVNNHHQDPLDIYMLSWVGIQLIIATAILFIYSYKLREDKSLGFQSLIIAIGLAIPTTGLIVFQYLLPVVLKINAVPITSYLITFLSISTVTALYKYKLFSLSELIDSELVLDELPVAVISITDTGTISYVNKYGTDFLALENSELQQKQLASALSYASDDYEVSFTNACNHVIRGDAIKNLESSLVISGQTHFVSVSASPLISNNNIEGALFCLRDITPLRKSIALLQENERSLAEAQRLSNLGSWEMDMHTRQMKLSDELYRIYDIPADEEVSYDQLLRYTHPDDLNLMRTRMLQKLGGNEVSEFTYRIVLNDNSVKYLNARLQNHLDPEANPDKHLGTVQDITKQVEIENAMHQKNLELQRMNESLEEFVFVASHDMKEPLRKIITFSDMIVKNEKDNLSEKSRNYFERMITSSHRMQTIIEDLLSVSGIFQNNENEVVSLHSLISDAIQDLDMRIKEKNAQVIYAHLPAHYVGSKQFRQVFFNLLNNSLKFSKTDIPPVINIACTNVSPKDAEKYKLAANQDYINITFSDNGIGFDNEYADKIFQMFERLHSTSEYDGTGIGLAVCKKIVEKHKGTIAASGTSGIGASFSVVIPKLIK